ncbi:Uncharacterized protein Adt_40169 [Abeliophyllum distichum]|uniref:Uncharacterized protein n=1 Tax=Abeliophyllum distichum TaxID=126358 RepID=A0ABD1Q767_9LAMI
MNIDLPRQDEPMRAHPVCRINTIIGGSYVGGHTINSRRNYAIVARKKPVERCQIYGHRPRVPPITDEVGIHYPHCDALVIHTIIARNELGRMLVDDDSAMNILFGNTFDQMEVDHDLTASSYRGGSPSL